MITYSTINSSDQDILALDLGKALRPEIIFQQFKDLPYPIFLDSSMDGAKGNRFSYVTADPFLVINSKGEDVTLTYRGKIIEHKGNPWEFLEQILKDYKIPRIESLPPFQGGALGYWGYDLARHLEKLPSNAEEDLDIPEMYLGIYDWVLACDNEKQKLTLISTGLPERNADYAKERAENVIGRLNKLDEDQTSLEQKHCVNFVSNFTLAEYTKAIRRVKEYLVSGDSYQVNLSQRFQSEYDGDTWDLYLKLREKNPSPFGAYIDFPEVKILSCSPEEFVNLYDRKVRVRPIKGTRPVGDNAKEIHSNTQQLLSSDKERAENLMIVDLIRNDLGKICKIGSIRVPNLFDVERHPSVLHLVSTVEGDLLESASPVDLLKACFPCGSVTGAPKLRSMEIIEELEPVRRNTYCGAIGYISFDGDMCTSIAIRMLTVSKGKIYMQLGGAIVADSDPYEEYEETLQKGQAILLAFNQF